MFQAIDPVFSEDHRQDTRTVFSLDFNLLIMTQVPPKGRLVLHGIFSITFYVTAFLKRQRRPGKSLFL